VSSQCITHQHQFWLLSEPWLAGPLFVLLHTYPDIYQKLLHNKEVKDGQFQSSVLYHFTQVSTQ